MYDQIELTPDTCGGAPRIKGRRITVYNVISMLFLGEKIDEYSKEYGVSIKSIQQAISYCKELKCQQDKPLHYCDGCILRTLNDGKWSFDKNQYMEYIDSDEQHYTVSQDGNDVFLGSLEELEDSEFGKPGWAMAAYVSQNI